MSRWVHIIAAIHIDTMKDMTNIKEYIEKELKNAPKISGSEGDADIFVNILSGYNSYDGADCSRCKYGDTVKETENYIECDSPNDFICPEANYQTCAVITIIGDLRDREYLVTRKEFKDFVDYLTESLDFWIDNITATIIDTVRGQYNLIPEIVEEKNGTIYRQVVDCHWRGDGYDCEN